MSTEWCSTGEELDDALAVDEAGTARRREELRAAR